MTKYNFKGQFMSLISEALSHLWLGASDSRSASRPEAPSSVPGGRLREAESPGTNKSSPSANKEEKGSVTGPLVAYQNLGEPVWAPRDYTAFAREGFMQNAIVYRSVRMIAEAAASIPLLLYDGTNEIEDHPLIDLLRRPSLDHTGTDFLEAWYGFLLVAGNAYVEAVALDGDVRELHILRPDRMKVIPGVDGWPEGYEYTVGGRSVRFFDDVVDGVRPILHVRLFHPANDHYGMSPIEAAATAIDIHNTASGWNKVLLDNSARPSGALVYAAANGQMTEEQFTRLKGELETNFQGARQAGRPLLLEGGLDWKPLSLTPKDMDFIEAKNVAAREIALAIGVPPMLLGIPGDNTYSNYQEAQRVFWRQTVLPLVNRTARALSSWLSPAFATRPALGGQLAERESPSANERLELKPDLDQIEALWKRLEAASFLTTDEKRAAAGYDTPPEIASRKYREDQPRIPGSRSSGAEVL
jgi:HK97 family phage portal protein